MARANGTPVFVEPSAFTQSVHAPLACVDCHADLATLTEFPHAEDLAPVDCAACHDEPATGVGRSVHATVKSAAGEPVGCVSCHGHRTASGPPPIRNHPPANCALRARAPNAMARPWRAAPCAGRPLPARSQTASMAWR
jgi:hypothetical protein